ncbi:D-Ala-D-Ala dipeptidase VanX-Sc [Glycomyces endophyticus]|uniref:D-alanyl-D-alanine dipeptidase n=1 Tax=Glycomyces endophyticus TaxID=480996 RepID=A0ABP4RYI9_9ACTN
MRRTPPHPPSPEPPPDFVFVDEHVPGVRWTAVYATAGNFTGAPVDGYRANRIVGTTALCAALAAAAEKARPLGFGLHLWDAYRPQRAVDRFLRWTAEPEDGAAKARHHPNIARTEMVERGYIAVRSGHSRGGTVDLTLFHLDTGALAATGGGHDLMDPVSHHGAPGVAPAAAANRRLLRSIMEDCGFRAYPWEWWHYTLEDEPYPDTYFDFPIEER